MFFIVWEVFRNGGFKKYFKKTTSFINCFLIALTNIALVHLIFGNQILKQISQNTNQHISNQYFIIGAIAYIFLLDFWTYIWHRLNHRIPFLWRFHEVHHLDESLHSLSAIRFHFGEVIISYALRFAIFLYLPISLDQYLIFEFLYAFFNIFAHADVRINFKTEKKIESIFVTPRFHRLHHHPDRKIHDSNYSTIFSFWDKLFKTYTPIDEKDSFLFGVREKKTKSFLGLLVSPFKNT